ncbi:MAG: sulfate adenylyltransferase [Negativicutes bacterium]|nr:sulfate adenylyltransferase [Negativicutes bacterium]
MTHDIKIICTIGPASKRVDIMKKLETRNIFLVRINLSHIAETEIEEYIIFLKKFNIPIAIDTEGSQIRTGNIESGNIVFRDDDIVRIHNSKVICDSNNIYLSPFNVVDYLTPGNILALDFNSVLLRVENPSMLKEKGFIECRVVIEGALGSNKGVHCDTLAYKLPPFSQKDLKAVELAKKYGIKYFTLSFIDNAGEVKEFKSIYPESIVYAKIETIRGVNDVSEILDNVEGILIDRGDLSREVPIQKIPIVQKMLIKEANDKKKEVFVATNLLETMANDLKPSRAEANDIVNTIIDGVTGFVLTKEIATGIYPLETINMLKAIIRQCDYILAPGTDGAQSSISSLNLKTLKDKDYISEIANNGFLIKPHGGKLIERYLSADEQQQIDFDNIFKMEVDENVLMDLEQIAIGTYSPLEGFLCRDDYQSVLDTMRLKSGVVWTIPVILNINKDQKDKLKIGEKIAIASHIDKQVYGIMEVAEIHPYNKSEYAEKVYGTLSADHPGVKKLDKYGDYLVGGKIKLVKRKTREFSYYNMMPRQIRNIFESLGWSKVVGFHTRNAIHRSHEFIQLQALEKTGCDGLFVQPIVGSKKSGDFNTGTIIRSYEVMLEKHYAKNSVVFGLFSTYSRYAGPREAIFTALCRKNFGCSHFIVGRDHTGVGNFYPPLASQEIFYKFDDLGIVPVFFDEIGYSELMGCYVNGNEHPEIPLMNISGTQARELFKQQVLPPSWFMRPEISQAIINDLKQGAEVFVS